MYFPRFCLILQELFQCIGAVAKHRTKISIQPFAFTPTSCELTPCRIFISVSDTMYSGKVLEHLDNPRNVGGMPDATMCGEATNPVCGDFLQLYLKVAEEKIVAVSFQAEACPPCVAAASVLTEMLQNLALPEAFQLQPADITRALGTLPRNKNHCPVLAIDALQAALKTC